MRIRSPTPVNRPRFLGLFREVAYIDGDFCAISVPWCMLILCMRSLLLYIVSAEMDSSMAPARGDCIGETTIERRNYMFPM